MSHRPTPRNSHDGFRPWKRDDERPDRPTTSDDRPNRAPGEVDSEGNYRTDKVWRSDAAHQAVERTRRPWQRRDDRDPPPGGFERRPWQRRDDRGPPPGGFERRPWQRRDDDRGGPPSGGFERRPWQRRDDRGGPPSGGFERRPWQRRDDRGGPPPGGFERRPWQHRDDDRRPRPQDDTKGERKRFPPQPEGELLYGRQPVREMLLAGRRKVREMILADGVKASEEITAIEALCLERSIPVKRHERETLDAWLNAANHQGLVAVCDGYPYVEFEEIHAALRSAEGQGLVVLLDHVVDPQNLGSLLRSCEAAGVCGVVIPADRAVSVTPAAVRASAGAAEYLRVAIVPSLVGAMDKLKDEEGRVWITGLEASPEAKPYTEIDFKGKVALVVGSEGMGLSRLVREHCDFLARLPMFGKVGSLNAGVAGALALYEVLRQQERK